MRDERDHLIAEIILDIAHQRGVGKTLCPSEVAKRVAEDWRPLMPEVRRVAAELAGKGTIVVTQKGLPVAVATARGPIRLGLA